jgi:hypothetical protein
MASRTEVKAKKVDVWATASAATADQLWSITDIGEVVFGHDPALFPSYSFTPYKKVQRRAKACGDWMTGEKLLFFSTGVSTSLF